MNGYHAENSYCQEYERLLLKLRHLVAEGRGEDDEAEAIRDRTDEPGRHFNNEEVAQLKALSADLYWRQPGEVQDSPFVR